MAHWLAKEHGVFRVAPNPINGRRRRKSGCELYMLGFVDDENGMATFNKFVKAVKCIEDVIKADKVHAKGFTHVISSWLNCLD